MLTSINLIKFINIHNQKLDFGDILLPSNTLLFNNCSNLVITCKNKINQIIVEKSKNISFNIHKLITGFDISKSDNIFIILQESIDSIPFIGIFCSSIYLFGTLIFYLNTIISCESSNLYHIDSIN